MPAKQIGKSCKQIDGYNALKTVEIKFDLPLKSSGGRAKMTYSQSDIFL